MTVESADRNCTDAYMEKLDDLFGLTSDFNAHVVSNLERTHAQDRIDTRSVRSSIIVRSVTIAMLVMTVGALALMISSLMGIIGGSADGIVGAWRRCYGLVPSALALTVNTTLLALVASINVALAAATGRADRQEDAINAYWRRMLGWCVYGAAAGASVFSFMQFAGIGGMNGTGGSDKSNTGTAIAAVCVGMLTVFLAVTLVEYGSASNRARNFVDAQKRRRDIAGWIFTIRQMDVPINIAAETGLRLKWLPKVPRFVVVMLIFGLFSLGYTYVAVEAVSLTYADRLFVRRPSWTDVVFAVSVVGYSAGISYVIGSTAWRRWSSPKRNLSRGMSPLGVKRLACRPPLCGLVG